MAAQALLRDLPNPSREADPRIPVGQLLPLHGYQAIVDAIEAVARRALRAPNELSSRGRSPRDLCWHGVPTEIPRCARDDKGESIAMSEFDDTTKNAQLRRAEQLRRALGDEAQRPGLTQAAASTSTTSCCAHGAPSRTLRSPTRTRRS